MAKLQKIIILPDKKLRGKSLEVKGISPYLKCFIEDMKLTMQKKDGVGLAAPQVGKNIRIIVVSHKDGELVLINPIIIKKSFLKEIDTEGCLSVPKIFGKVKRNKSVVVSAINEELKPFKYSAKGLFARVLQHEIDHLDGILFIDKLEKEPKQINEECI